MHTSRNMLLGACVAVAQAAAADTLPPQQPLQLRYDHANPFVLNEFALQKVRAGDTGTAVILLERAALIAPYDARIRHNLDVLRNRQAGKQPEAPHEPGIGREPMTAPAAALEAKLPEISPWPLK